jgi:hypothetical protein
MFKSLQARPVVTTGSERKRSPHTQLLVLPLLLLLLLLCRRCSRGQCRLCCLQQQQHATAYVGSTRWQ